MQEKNPKDKKEVIKSIYFYLVSFITLGITIGSLIFLVNLGFRQYIFPDSDPFEYRIGAPPVLYFSSDKPTASLAEETALTCDEECSLTTSQKSSIDNWVENYAVWIENKDNDTDRALDLVQGLSFLIVALPIFLIHFRTAQKSAKKDEAGKFTTVRSTYFYAASFAALLMFIISGGILVNIGLKAWIIPDSDNSYKNNLRYAVEEPFALSQTATVQSIIDCGDKCEIDAETVTQAKSWLVDYQAWEDVSINRLQRDTAGALPFVLFGIPIFWYHWSVARRESKEKSAKGGSASDRKNEESNNNQ